MQSVFFFFPISIGNKKDKCKHPHNAIGCYPLTQTALEHRASKERLSGLPASMNFLCCSQQYLDVAHEPFKIIN